MERKNEKLKPDDPEQSKRFEETAKNVGAVLDEKKFEKVLKAIIPSPARKSSSK
ncbi:MAG TPA: hypothetical protein PLS60_06945 [Arenimonas sp.]|nr:hypothetical protein [Arenimonas sp.]